MGLFTNPMKELEAALKSLHTNFVHNNGNLGNVAGARDRCRAAVTKARKRGKTAEVSTMLQEYRRKSVEPVNAVFFRADSVDKSGRSFDAAAERAKQQQKPAKAPNPELLERMRANWDTLIDELMS